MPYLGTSVSRFQNSQWFVHGLVTFIYPDWIIHRWMLYSQEQLIILCIFNAVKIIIGVGRFRILGGGQGLEYWGAKGGPNSQQAHDVVMTSMRRNDVASTSFRRHVPTRFLINQCQIITFLIKIWYYRKFKGRIERNSFDSTLKSN